MKHFELEIPPLFAFDECHGWLDRKYQECSHQVNSGKIRKWLLLNSIPVLIDIEMVDEMLKVTYTSKEEIIESDVQFYIRDWLDMDRDIAPFYSLLRKTEKLAYMALDFSGLRLIGIPDMHEALCWSIIGQQINLTFAHKLKCALMNRYGESVRFGSEAYHIFPSAEVISSLSKEQLLDLQFSRQKADYIIGVSKAFVASDISKEVLLPLSHLQRLDRLTQLKGVGEWTANYVLMKSLKDMDSIPFGDSGLLDALGRHGFISNRTERAKIENLFGQFKGWQSYLALYLWRSLT
jgi:DNA-3-methyladenine glycosylase II